MGSVGSGGHDLAGSSQTAPQEYNSRLEHLGARIIRVAWDYFDARSGDRNNDSHNSYFAVYLRDDVGAWLDAVHPDQQLAHHPGLICDNNADRLVEPTAGPRFS